MTQPARARRWILLGAALAVAAIGSALVLVTARGRPAQSPPAPEGSPEAPAAEAAPAPAGAAALAAPRDVRLDRSFTTSDEAFRLYSDGVGLASTLPVQAMTRFARAAELDPRFAPARYRLAMSAALAGRGRDGLAAVRAALDRPEALPDPYRSAAGPLSRFLEGAFDLTSHALRDALAAHPADPDVNAVAGMLAACSCDHFDPNAVVERLETSLERTGGPPSLRRRLVEAYGMKEMHDWALEQSRRHAAAWPEALDALAEPGVVRLWRREYGDAVEVADEVLRRGGDVFAVGLAPAFILTGQHAELRSMYDPEMEHGNSIEANAVTHLHAGINDVWLGRFGDAETHFSRGPEFAASAWEKSRAALFFLLLGRARALEERFAEAHQALEAAQRLAGPQAVLEYALGVNHLRAGRPAETERALYRLSSERHRSQPGWTEPWRRLLEAEVALAAGRATVAADAAREAWMLERPLSVDCVTGHADAYFLDVLGRASLEARRPADALDAFEQIRALGMKGLHQPEITALAGYRSALVLASTGRPDEARVRLEQFIRQWAGAEDHPLVRDARQRLQRIGERG
ncbi:MAG TPA: hypothetical protein VJV23_16675 [Candidatus Polarisedimenticolia bacterium]|nr:hypothetical protein [Candidatus Polarisedimenticolia bacterium]